MAMRVATAIVASGLIVLTGACARAPTWDETPLAPRLAFAEPVAPGTLVVLVTDAHSGAPLPGAVVTLQQHLSRRAMSDSLGRARLTDLPPGTHRVWVR